MTRRRRDPASPGRRRRTAVPVKEHALARTPAPLALSIVLLAASPAVAVAPASIAGDLLECESPNALDDVRTGRVNRSTHPR